MSWDSSSCRICLNGDLEGVELGLQVDINNEYTYLDLFNSCTGLGATLDDSLPQMICNSCSNDLFIAFEFLNRAVASDQYFKDTLNTDKVSNCDSAREDNENENSQTKVEMLTSIELQAEKTEEFQYELDIQAVPGVTDIFEIIECEPKEELLSDEFEEDIDFIRAMKNDIAKDYLAEDVKEDIKICPRTESAIHGKTIVQCYICDKKLKRWSMKHHIERCHKKEQVYLCSACPKTFTIKGDLKTHMKRHDTTRERKFVCNLCGKRFFENQSLKSHMRVHDRKREFQCQKCDKKFLTKKSLEVHEFTHDRLSGRFVCKHCDKRFTSNADLTVHERFHTGDYPYKCEICDKSYAVKSHYNYHVAKHDGVTYQCDQCDKVFLHRGSLTAHKYKHQDKMPHECSVCFKGFTSPFKLNRHLMTHKAKDKESY